MERMNGGERWKDEREGGQKKVYGQKARRNGGCIGVGRIMGRDNEGEMRGRWLEGREQENKLLRFVWFLVL